jgi:fucose permease
VLLGAISVAIVGALLLIVTRSASLAALGVFLVGCGFAPVFPLILGFVGDRYANLSGTAFSVVIVMALIGGMLLPYLTGVIGAVHGLRGSLVIVPVALLALGMLLLASRERVAAR